MALINPFHCARVSLMQISVMCDGVFLIVGRLLCTHVGIVIVEQTIIKADCLWYSA